MHDPLRYRLSELKRDYEAARRRHPRILFSVIGAFVLVASIALVGGVSFLTGLREGLPDLDALHRIGEMDQATAVFDDTDRLAFTIFKEQRIEVALDDISPNLTKALIAIEDQRFNEHRGFDLVRIASSAAAKPKRWPRLASFSSFASLNRSNGSNPTTFRPSATKFDKALMS